VNTTKTLTTSSNAVSKDTTKPKVIKTNPVNNRYVFTTAPGQSIIVTFSERVTLGSGWVVLVNSKGVVIPFKLSISGNAMTINPYSDLTNGMVYGVLIHTGSITDHSGNSVVPYVFRFGVQPKASAVPASLNPYLLPSANCQSTNPKIIALAKSITKGSTSQYTSAVKIYNWVRDNINYAFYYNTQKGALGTLSSRSANCADTAHLMVALERAAGIPARYEHIYAQFSSGNWYGHVIAQVYVNGKWYYADGTSYRNSFGVVKNWNTGTFKLEGVYRSLPF
jgi:transglutaminase-like putative cysteine protease